MLNLVWLRSFCSLVEVGHFTRTAEALHMTQSGVSQHIQKLEEHLGKPLLVRQGKKFTLTSAGDRLYHEGCRLLQSLSDLESQLGLDPEYEGSVRLASPGSVGLKLYPLLLALQKQHPKLAIEYRFAPNGDVETLLSENKVDIGLMTCLSNLPEIKLKAIGNEELLLITPNQVIDPSWESLVELGFIDHPDGAYHAGQLLKLNYPKFQHCRQLRRSGFSNQINLILEPVSMGLGFTILPRYALDAFRDNKQVKVHQLKHSVSEHVYLGINKNAFIPRRVKTVMAETVKCLQLN